MSKTVHDVSLAALMPGSVIWDADTQRLADAVDPELKAVMAAIRDSMPNLYSIDTLAERVVDLLAWEYHVDFPPRSGSLADKRDQVKTSFAEHRLHGTRAAVRILCDQYFGVGGYQLQEWFEYGGEPFWFRITYSEPFDADTWAEFQRRIQVVKSLRSWMESYLAVDGAGSIRIGFGALLSINMTITEEQPT